MNDTEPYLPSSAGGRRLRFTAAITVVTVVLLVFTGCSGKPDNDQRHTLATDLATLDQVMAVLEHRLADVSGASIETTILGGERRIVVETSSRLIDRAQLEELMLRPGALAFRRVDGDNRTLSKNALIKGKTPNGFKVVESKIAGYTKDYLMAWNLQDWRDHPKVAEQFGLDLQDEAAFEAAIHRPAFAEKIEQTLREFRPATNSNLMLKRMKASKPDEVLYEPLYVEVQPRMTGSSVKKAEFELSAGERFVLLTFTPQGRKEFGKLSTRLGPKGDLAATPLIDTWGKPLPVGAGLALVLDGVLLTAPLINEPILGGEALITEDFSVDEAATLVQLLNAGQYPAPVTLLSHEKLP